MSDHIYLRGTTWWGRVTVRGTEHRRSLRTADEATARLALADWLSSLARGPRGHDPLWEEAVVDWSTMIDTLDGGDGLKAKVKERYVESLRMFHPFWSGRRLSQIGRREVADFVRERKKGFLRRNADGTLVTLRKVTNATIRRDLTAASSVFRVAVASGHTDHNPPREWDRSVIKERKRVMVPPLPHEIEAVQRYAHKNFARLIAFAAATGMRQAECVKVEWRDYRPDRGELLLPSTKVSRPRVIALDSVGGNAVGTLVGTPRHIRSQVLFWHGVDGVAYAQASGEFRAVMAKAVDGEAAEQREFKRFRFHDLRHAFAIRWLLNGGDIYKLSKHLGHTSVKTTEIYLAYLADYDAALARHKSGTPSPVLSGTGSM